MNLNTLNDEEFLRAAYAEHDELTATTFQVEALRRLQANVDAAENAAGFLALSDEYSVDADALRHVIESSAATIEDQAKLLALLNDEDITNPGELEAVLKSVKEFRSLANDAGEVITRLATLISTTQES